MIDPTLIGVYMREVNPIPHLDDLDPDEFARFVAIAEARHTAAFEPTAATTGAGTVLTRTGEKDMTNVTQQKPEFTASKPAPVTPAGQRRNRLVFGVAMALLVIAVGAVGWWLGSSTSDSDTVAKSAEIEQIIDDYVNATLGGEVFDPVAFRDIVTDDFVDSKYIYRQFGDQLVMADYFAPLDKFTPSSVYQLDLLGEPVVTGEGPWFASVVENYGVGEWERYVGTSTYVIVDEDGTLKVADRYWAGLHEVDPASE